MKKLRFSLILILLYINCYTQNKMKDYLTDNFISKLANSKNIKSITQIQFVKLNSDKIDTKNHILEYYLDDNSCLAEIKEGYGKIESTTRYIKDENNLKILNYENPEKLILSTFISFGLNEEILNEQIYNSENEQIRNTIYIYDKNGLIEITEESMNKKSSYIYRKNKLVSRVYNYKNDDNFILQKFEYKEKKEILKEFNVSKKTQIEVLYSITENTLNDSNIIIRSLFNKNDVPSEKHLMIYNENGLQTEFVILNNDNQIELKINTSYDLNGNETEIVNMSKNKINFITEYIYEYDKNNNWIKRTQMIDKIQNEIIVREILYK